MNYHQDYEILPQYLPQDVQVYSTTQKVITTLALLTLGYFILTFFDAWPSTIKRSTYEILVYLIPSQAIYALQHIMTRFGHVSPNTSRFRRSDFGNQHAKAEAIQRMLGYGPIPNVLRKARSLSGLEMLKPASQTIVPPGLGNWDNSCYQNSILQAFASLPAFSQYVGKILQLSGELGTSTATTQALSIFMEQLNEVSRSKTIIWTPGVLKSMDSWQQQDAQEYFSRVLDAIEKEAMQCNNRLKRRTGTGLEIELMKSHPIVGIPPTANAATGDSAEHKHLDVPATSSIPDEPQDDRDLQVSSSNNRTLLETAYQNPLDGMLAQALECRTCGFSEGISMTQFNCLTLNMNLRGHSHLEDLLEEYTEPETVEDVECLRCTKEAVDQTGSTLGDDEKSQASMSDVQTKPKPKPVLRTKEKQITVGRLPKILALHLNRSIFDEYGNQLKNTALIRFPERLKFLGRWSVALDTEDNDVSCVYELRCTVTHYGRHDNGHYIALGKRGKEWFCFNDEIVTKVSLEDVLARGNVFMLFYEAVSSVPIGKPTLQDDGVVETTDEGMEVFSSNSSENAPNDEHPRSVPPATIPVLRTASESATSVEPAIVIANPLVTAQ